MSKMKLLLDMVQDMRSLADSLQTLADALCQEEQISETEPAPEAIPQEPPKVITLEEVRAVLAEKSRAGHTAAIRDLLQKYGASKLSKIEPQYYEALLREAEVLGDAP